MTSREYGRFSHDPELFPPENHKAKTHNNRSSGFHKQMVSQFALEDLPVAERML